MKPTARWASEALVIYAVTFWPVARLVNENPIQLWELAIPPMFMLLVVIIAWPSLTSLLGTRDSFGNLLLATFFSALGASLVSAFCMALLFGAFTSDPGEIGGAVLLIISFTSALFSCLALPPAFILPRLLDPMLHLRVFRSPQ
jgi:hypothetical protein